MRFFYVVLYLSLEVENVEDSVLPQSRRQEPIVSSEQRLIRLQLLQLVCVK